LYKTQRQKGLGSEDTVLSGKNKRDHANAFDTSLVSEAAMDDETTQEIPQQNRKATEKTS